MRRCPLMCPSISVDPTAPACVAELLGCRHHARISSPPPQQAAAPPAAHHRTPSLFAWDTVAALLPSTLQDKAALKASKDAAEAKYKVALVDGREEQVCDGECGEGGPVKEGGVYGMHGMVARAGKGLRLAR